MPDKTAQKCSEGNTEPPSTKTRKREFCFTHFDEHTHAPNLSGPWLYIIMGREICPETKRQHFQSYVYFKDPKTLTACANILEKHFGKRPHVKLCNGNLEQNFTYCTKDKDYYEYGTKPSQGKRNDLIAIKEEILAQELTCDEIACNNPILYHQYGRTLNKLEDIALRKNFRTEMTKGIWYYGPTGVGKSHIAFKDFTPESHYVYRNDNGWWEGYTQQDTVIINDFRGEIKYNELLQLIDKYPYYVKRRCREPMPFTSKLVIITSSLHPKDIYHNRDAEDSIEQLLRRFEIIELKKMEF